MNDASKLQECRKRRGIIFWIRVARLFIGSGPWFLCYAFQTSSTDLWEFEKTKWLNVTSRKGPFCWNLFNVEKKAILVGGWTNPFEKICSSNWIISPIFGMKIQKIFELPPRRKQYNTVPLQLPPGSKPLFAYGQAHTWFCKIHAERGKSLPWPVRTWLKLPTKQCTLWDQEIRTKKRLSFWTFCQVAKDWYDQHTWAEIP